MNGIFISRVLPASATVVGIEVEICPMPWPVGAAATIVFSIFAGLVAISSCWSCSLDVVSASSATPLDSAVALAAEDEVSTGAAAEDIGPEEEEEMSAAAAAAACCGAETVTSLKEICAPSGNYQNVT